MTSAASDKRWQAQLEKPTHNLSSPHLDAVRNWKPPTPKSARKRDELDDQLDLLRAEDDEP